VKETQKRPRRKRGGGGISGHFLVDEVCLAEEPEDHDADEVIY
jgi:hypothetical protein